MLSDYYNEMRTDYYRQLDMAKKGPVAFILYALQGFVDALRDQLKVIHEQQIDVALENFVHQTFHDRTSTASVRQRWLVLDLSRNAEPVPRSKLRRLTPRLAEAYAGKTDKTHTRDVNALRDLDLITSVPGGWVAKKGRILAFLPNATPEEGGDTQPDSQLPLVPDEG